MSSIADPISSLGSPSHWRVPVKWVHVQTLKVLFCDFWRVCRFPLLHTCVKSQWASRPEEGVRKHCSGGGEENDRISQDWPKILCEASVASFEVADTQREREVTACNFQTTRHTVSHSWRHRKKMDTVADFETHTAGNTPCHTVEDILCHSVEVTQTNNVAEGDIKLQTLRHTKLTPPPPSTLEWHPHNSPCAHPPPHFELYYSGNVCFPTFTAMPLFEAIHSAFLECVKLCRCLTQQTVGSPSID